MLHAIIGILVSMVDPISLAGYLIAGIVAREYWIALVAAVFWRVFLQIALVSNAGVSSPTGFTYSIIGSLVATSVIYAVAAKVRHKKEM